jgi:multidrug resistance efflux pump
MVAFEVRLVRLAALVFLVLLAASAAFWFVPVPRLSAEESAAPGAKGRALEELQKERLATLREFAKLATDAYQKGGTGSYLEVRRATRMLLEAELEGCGTEKQRIAVLEKVVAQAKDLEKHAAALYKAGVIPMRTVLEAKADRLQVEIALERAKGRVSAPADLELSEQVALLEKRVAIRRVELKLAESQKKIAAARLTSVRAQVAEARATESAAAKEFDRFQGLVKDHVVTMGILDQRRAQWEAAKAHRMMAEGKVAEGEGEVLLEQTRVELAQLKLEEAELRLKQVKARLEPKRSDGRGETNR